MKKLLISLTLAFSSPSIFANSTVDPTAVAQAYFDNLRSGKMLELMELFADDVVWHQPGKNILSGTYVGKKQVAELFGRFMKISKGTFKIDEVYELMVNGKNVAANLHFSVTECHHLEYVLSMKGIDLIRIENGKIKEVTLFSSNQAAEDACWGKKE